MSNAKSEMTRIYQIGRRLAYSVYLLSAPELTLHEN